MANSNPNFPRLRSNETPIDRALALRLHGEHEASLRWAVAILQVEPELPSALLLVCELLIELGRPESAREGLEVCLTRAMDAGLLPLAVATCIAQKRAQFDATLGYDAIADTFCCTSSRLDEDAQLPPPPPPKTQEFHPLSSLLTGPSLLNKSVDILKNAVALMRSNAREEETTTLLPMLPKLPLFSSLSRESLRALIEIFDTQVVSSDEVIIEEDSPGNEAFIVARGELEVRKKTPPSKDSFVLLAILQNGQIFGEMSLVSQAPRSASVIATRPSILLRASVDAFENIAARAPEVGEQLAQFCRDRMIQNLFRTSALLRSLDAEEQSEVIQQFETRSYEIGHPIIQQGHSPTGLYLIASGQVDVMATESNESLRLATLFPGDVFGEVALLLRRTSNATVIATQPTVVLFLAADKIFPLLQKHPNLLSELYNLAIQREEETLSVVAQEATSVDNDILV